MELDKIPGLKEAVSAAAQEEASARELAFLDLPLEICGIEVRPFTPRHFLNLGIARSPFLCGGNISSGDVGVFLWTISPMYSIDSDARGEFIQSIVSLTFDQCVKEIDAYLDAAFMDRPAGAAGPSRPAITAFAASIVDDLASQYHWSEETILNLPFTRIYQYLRRIERRLNPDAVFFNRLSDRAKRKCVDQYLASLPKKAKRKTKGKR